MRTTQQAKLLYAFGEGEIEGPVHATDGLRDLYLNDVPVKTDGGFNFTGLNFMLTSGTLTQESLSGFSDTESLVTSGAQITHGNPQTYSVSADYNATRVNVYLPSLWMQDTSNGNMGGDAVTLKLEVSCNGGAFQDVSAQFGDGRTLDGYSEGPVVRSFRIQLDSLGAGPWVVRVSRVTADNSSLYRSNLTYIQSYALITDAQLYYPGTAMGALCVDASRFSAVPTVKMRLRGVKVLVPTNYTAARKDPDTGVWTAAIYATSGAGTTGGAWDGTFKTAWSSNPAWVFLDACTNKRYGVGKYLNLADVDKGLLYQIAQYCDQMVSDGQDGTEPRFSYNGYLKDQEEAFMAMAHILSSARSRAYWGGGMVSPVQDCDQPVNQIFTPSNVKDGKFTYQGTSLSDRHTVAVVSWNDPAQNWALVPEVVQADRASILRYGINKVEVTLPGCTSRGQAHRHGLWTLESELNEPEFVTFTIGLEGLRSKPGQVILIQDPGRKRAQLGGRIKAVTASTVTLDRSVTLQAGQAYSLNVMLPSGGVVTKAVTTAAGTTNVLTISGTFATLPQIMGQWILTCPATPATRWVIMAIRENHTENERSFDVTALANYEAKYALIDGSTTLPAIFHYHEREHTSPSAPSVTHTSKYQADRISYSLTASWPTPSAASAPTGYQAQARKDNGAWRDMTVTGNSATLQDIQTGTYDVRVAAIYASGTSDFVVTSGHVVGDAGNSPAEQALAALGVIASDNLISPGEKTQVFNDWKALYDEHSGIDAQATSYGITTEKTAYDTAWSALQTYLNASPISMQAPPTDGASWCADASNIAITGTTFRSNFATVYSSRQALLNAIYAAAKALANTAQNTANAASGTAVWGGIGGTLANQTDLVNALGTKANLSGAAFTGPVSATSLGVTTTSSNTSARNWSLGQTQAYGEFDLRISTAQGGDAVSSGTTLQSWTASGSTLTVALSGTSAVFSGQVSAAYGSGFALVNGATVLASLKYSGGTVLDRASGTALYFSEGGSNQVYIASGGKLYGTYGIFSSGVTASNPSGDCFDADSSAGAYAFYALSSGGVNRWRIGKDNVSESGSNAGSSLGIWAYSDTGTALGQWFTMRRSDGTFWFGGPAGYINNSPILTLANVGTNAATLQAAVANAQAPMVGTLAQMNAYSVPAGTSPYWYATDVTAPDGQLGTLYHWTGSAWTSVGNPSAIIGRLTAAVISAGAIGAQALAATIAMTSILQSVPYSAGSSTAIPTGFKLSGTAFTAHCFNGDSSGALATSPSVVMELGTGVSIAGYDVSNLALARLVNGGTKVYTPGTYTWRCPPGIFWLYLTLQGGGGSGACTTTTTPGGGGGAGGYVKVKLPVTPYKDYTIVVGTGGTAVATSGNGVAGGASSFNADSGTITCAGGQGGTTAGVGGNGGGVTAPFLGGMSGQVGSTSADLGVVNPIVGGTLLGAMGGCAGGSSNHKNGYTGLWGTVGVAGGGASTFSDMYATSSSTPYGYGSHGGVSSAGTAQGGPGTAMLEW